jgi:hypothetical protein
MKLDPGIYIVMHSVLFLKPGVTRPIRPHDVWRRSAAAGACTPSSLYCAATPCSRTGVRPLPLRQHHDVEAVSSEQLAELVPSRRRLPSSSQSCDGRQDKYLPSLHCLVHLISTPNPSSSFDLLSSSLCFLRLPRLEHGDL